MRATTSALVALIAAISTPPAVADVRSDSFDSPTRDAALWNELESYRDTTALRDKVEIYQDGTALRIDGLGGKGGGAAYTSAYRIDWNDGFRASFRADATAFSATLPTQSAVVGVSFGFDAAWSLVRGYRTAIVVEIESTPLGRTVQVAFRKGALVIAESPKVPLSDGWHDFDFEFLTNGPDNTISMNLFADGADTPVAAIPAFQGPVGLDAKGVTAAIYGIARGTPLFSASFDDFGFEGDLFAELDDSAWEDIDEHADGPSGERTESADDFQLHQALMTAVMRSVWAAETIIAAEVRDGSIVFVFRETAARVRVVKASLVDQSLVDDFTRPARIDERAAMASVWNGASVAGSDAVDYILHVEPGTYFIRGLLNLKSTPRRWDIRVGLDAGGVADRMVLADGNTGGDGITSLAPMLFSGAIISAYDAYPAGQGRVISAAMVNGVLEVVFVHATIADWVRVVRLQPRTGAPMGGVSRSATSDELFGIQHASQYGIAEAVWYISLDNGGAPVMSWAIVDLGGGDAGSHTRMRLDTGEIIDDYR